MSAGWSAVALGDISSIAYGYTQSASSDPVGPKFLRITDIQNDKVEWTSVPYCPIESAEFCRHRLVDGDIVFARTGATTGKSFLVRQPPEAVPASYLIRLRLTDERVAPEFLSLFFQTEEYWRAIREGTSGSAQGGFNASKLAALRLPLPPLEEQRRIVAVLDEAFAAIATATANAEKNLANARELFDRVSGTLFEKAEAGWGDVPLAAVSDFQGGSQPPKATFVDSPRPGYVRLLQIRDYKSDKAAVYIPESKRNKLCREDDIMIARYGASVGQIHRGKAGAYNVALIRTIPDESRIDKDYFYHFLKSPRFQVPLMAVASRSAQDGFSKEDIAPIRVPLPPVDEQKRLITELLRLDCECAELVTLYRAKLESLTGLKQSLLQRAFSGELTAREPLAA